MLTLTDWSTCRPHAILLADAGSSANQGVPRIAGVGGYRVHCGPTAVQKLSIVDCLDFPTVHWSTSGGRVWPHPSTLALSRTNTDEGKTSIAAVRCHIICNHNSTVIWCWKLGALLSYMHIDGEWSVWGRKGKGMWGRDEGGKMVERVSSKERMGKMLINESISLLHTCAKWIISKPFPSDLAHSRTESIEDKAIIANVLGSETKSSPCHLDITIRWSL